LWGSVRLLLKTNRGILVLGAIEGQLTAENPPNVACRALMKAPMGLQRLMQTLSYPIVAAEVSLKSSGFPREKGEYVYNGQGRTPIFIFLKNTASIVKP
jgi:hypothetical protein